MCLCLTFTFDYSQAFGAAGGVFAFAVFGIRTVIGIIAWLKSNAWKRCLLFSLVTSYFVVSLGAILLGYTCSSFQALDARTNKGAPPNGVHYNLYRRFHCDTSVIFYVFNIPEFVV